MAQRKRPTAKKRSGESAEVRAAIANGREVAEEVLAFRARQRRGRAARAASAAKAGPRRAPGVDRIPAKTLTKLGPKPTAGVVIAEGDSWFDYPFWDVLRILEDDYLYDVESVAHKGDCVEDMAHSAGQFEELARRLEKLLREKKVPRAILLSGGGNDIAGDEFAILLNHAASGLPALNEDIVRGVIDVRLRTAYAKMISGVTEIAKAYLGKPIPIVTHGYDYPVPDGRGVLGGFWKLPGPWLKPGFERKGYGNLNTNKQVIAELIDRFNTMLAGVTAAPQFQHVHFVDLRGTLRRDASYKKDWGNELHPTERGFETVTAKFAKTIGKL